MSKLNFSIAINLLTQGVTKGAQQVQNTFNKIKRAASSTLGNLGIGLGFGSYFQGMINAGRSFEDAMSRVKAVTNATASDFKKMRDEAVKMGANTKYSATEAANALENLTRNGLTASDATEALSKNLHFAQANSVDLAMGADILTNTMNEFGLKVSDLEKISDILSSTAAHSATNVELLGDALTNAAPLAKNCGIGIQETNAALGTLANVGIKGSDAGTALRQFFLGLSHDTPKGQAALKKYGLQINQTTLQADGLQKTLEKLSKSGIGKDNNALSDVFGSRAFAGAASLINNYEKFVSLNDTLSQSSGETSRMFGQSTGKMENDIKSLESAWEHFQIMFFDSSESLYTAPVEALTEFIRFAANNLASLGQLIVSIFAGIKLKKWFSEWSTASKESSSIAVRNAQKAHAKVMALKKERATIEKKITALETQMSAATGQEKTYAEIQYYQKKGELQAADIAYQKAQAAETVAIQKAAQMQTLTGWRAAVAGVKSAFSSLAASIKGIFSSIKWMVMVEVVMQLISGVKRLAESWRGAKGIVEDYNGEIAKSTHSTEITQLEQIKRRLNENKNNQNAIPGIIAEANKALGTSYSRYQDINNALRDKIELLKTAAQIEGVNNAISNLEQEQSEIYSRQGVSSQDELADKFKRVRGSRWAIKFTKESWADAFNNLFGGITGKHSVLPDYARSIQIQDAKNILQKRLDSLISDSAKATGTSPGKPAPPSPSPSPGTGGGSNGDSKKNQLQEEYESTVKSYNEQVKKLTAQLNAGYITQSEYMQSMRELNRETALDIIASKNTILTQSKFAQSISDALKSEPSDTLIRFTEISEELAKKEQEFQNGLDNGIASADDLTEGMREAYLSAIKEASSLGDLTDAQKALINGWVTKLQGFSMGSFTPTSTGGRDTTFDYKKTKKEKLELDLDDAKRQLEELQQLAKDSFGGLDEELNKLSKKKVDLEKAIKIEELREDISRLKKESLDNLFAPFESLDSIKDGVEDLINTLNSPDTDGWERLIAVFKTLKRVIDGISETIDSIEAIKDAFNELSEAKQQEAATDTTTANTEIANAEAKAAASTAATATNAANAATDVSANTADAASSAAAGAAKLPFPYNLIAIAGAITAVFGIMASLKHFANGGIVKGQPFDGSLAAVSDGEMILNGTQQSKLWRAINSGQTGGVGKVEFVISGRSLKGVLKNENNKMSKI